MVLAAACPRHEGQRLGILSRVRDSLVSSRTLPRIFVEAGPPMRFWVFSFFFAYGVDQLRSLETSLRIFISVLVYYYIIITSSFLSKHRKSILNVYSITRAARWQLPAVEIVAWIIGFRPINRAHTNHRLPLPISKRKRWLTPWKRNIKPKGQPMPFWPAWQSSATNWHQRTTMFRKCEMQQKELAWSYNRYVFSIYLFIIFLESRIDSLLRSC